MTRFTSACMAFVLALACEAAASQGGGSAPSPALADARVQTALAQLDAHFAKVVADGNLPGLSAGVVYGDTLIWSNGYGYTDVVRHVPAGAKSIYDIGSVAKLFNAIMLMQLRDAGKLNLDDPIEKYLPEFRFQSRFPGTRPPTFRQVVAHIGGLPREYGFDPSVPAELRHPPAAEVLAGIRKAELAYPPLTRVHYSNIGIYLMGQALQRIAGQPYKEYVREHILRPLGMNDTDWDLTEGMQAHYALGYLPAAADGSRAVGPLWVAGDFGMPAGGLHSSVEDLAKFVSFQLGDGGRGESRILNASTRREMRLPIALADDWSSGYGIGWAVHRVNDHVVIGHSGGTPSYCSFVALIPDLKLGVVILINQMTDQQFPIGDRAVELLLPAFEVIAAEARARDQSARVGAVEALMGRYHNAALGLEADLVTREGKVLLLPAASPGEPQERIELDPEDEQHFRVVSGMGVNVGEVLRFTRDPQTGAARFRFQTIVLERTGPPGP